MLSSLIGKLKKSLNSLSYEVNIRNASNAIERAIPLGVPYEIYKGLHPLSLSFAAIKIDLTDDRSINIVLPNAQRTAIFAGIKTAIEFSVGLANNLGLDLRVIVLGRRLSIEQKLETATYIKDEFGLKKDLLILNLAELVRARFHREDLWLATFWTTAHALHVAASMSLISREKIVYLIQDYEPGFMAWSTDYATAKSTYHAGFKLVVNSLPLAKYLENAEGIIIEEDFVFAPSLDLARLERTAKSRTSRKTLEIFFYARPSKPRNLYSIGVAALKIAAAKCDDNVNFYSFGEKHPNIRLSKKATLISLGKLPWDEYFNRLAQADVLLTLQYSPHPSHPPYDAVVSGGIAVTNEFGEGRKGQHPGLFVGEASPEGLAVEITRALLAARQKSAGYNPHIIAVLGSPIQRVIKSVAAYLA